MKFSLLYLPVIGTRAELEAGMAGIDGRLYDRMLAQVREQVELADQLGYYAVFFTEHHLEVEGFEISNNPVLLDLYVGQNTRQIRLGTMGIPLTAEHPLRVAEDIAMLDRMTGGRAIAGFTLGAQPRWLMVMGQHVLSAELSQFSRQERMRIQAEIFNEAYEIVIKAWREKTFSYQGRYWKIPPSGLYWKNPTCVRLGQGVEEDGLITEVGIAPKPVQQPHPPVWRPFVSSEETLRWCVRENVTPVITGLTPEGMRRALGWLADERRRLGKDSGDSNEVALFYDVFVAETDQEARELVMEGSLWAYMQWQGALGVAEKFRPEGYQGPMTEQVMWETDSVIAGSPETVRRRIEELREAYNPAHLVFLVYNSVIPHHKMLRSLELFAERVMPRFREPATARGR